MASDRNPAESQAVKNSDTTERTNEEATIGPAVEAEGGGADGTQQLVPLLEEVQSELSNLELPSEIVSAMTAQLRNMIKDPAAAGEYLEDFIEYLRRGNGRADGFATEIEGVLPPDAEIAKTKASVDGEKLESRPAGSVKSDVTDSPGCIPLDHIVISKWNGSYGQTPDDTAVEKLADSIDEHGLFHRLSLVVVPGTDDQYAVVCGANRLEALKRIRRDSQEIPPDEYRIIPNLTENDVRCLDISVSENADRRNLSPYTQAQYFHRLVNVEGIKQNEVATRMGIQRETVNSLYALPKYYEDLPESWQADLAAVDCDLNHKSKPNITMSHWRIVAPKVKKDGVTEKLHDILEQAARDEWTISQLKNAMDNLKPVGPDLCGILAALGSAKDLADSDKKILALLNPVIAEIEQMQQAAEKQKEA